MTRLKLIIATIGAILLLGALAANATAGHYSSTSQTFRATFRTVTRSGLFGTIKCQLTLEGSLHARTMTKATGALIGYITEAMLGPCEQGTETILTETLPWHIQQDGYVGALPRILRIIVRIIGFRLLMREPAFTCLATSTLENPYTLTFERNTATGVLSDATLGGISVETTCGRAVSVVSDRGPVTVLNSTTRVTVILI